MPEGGARHATLLGHATEDCACSVVGDGDEAARLHETGAHAAKPAESQVALPLARRMWFHKAIGAQDGRFAGDALSPSLARRSPSCVALDHGAALTRLAFSAGSVRRAFQVERYGSSTEDGVTVGADVRTGCLRL